MTEVNKSPSPYMILKEWFYKPDEEELDEKVIKALTPVSVLSMFGKHSNLTIFLNKYYNNYTIFELDHYQFYKMLKKIVKEKSLNKYNFSFFRKMSEDKKIIDIRKKFPTLKKYEIITLMDILTEKDMLEKFEETLGMTKTKKKKMTKKEIKENSATKVKKSKNEITVDELFSDFC